MTVSCGGSNSPNADARSIKATLGPPHPREVKLSLCDSAGALEHDCILAVAGEFADEGVQLFGNCRG